MNDQATGPKKRAAGEAARNVSPGDGARRIHRTASRGQAVSGQPTARLPAGRVMTPLELAALDAQREAESLWAEAEHAMTLEDQSGLLYDVATDAIEAFTRARDRAREARLLADHYSGAYNAWQNAGQP